VQIVKKNMSNIVTFLPLFIGRNSTLGDSHGTLTYCGRPVQKRRVTVHNGDGWEDYQFFVTVNDGTEYVIMELSRGPEGRAYFAFNVKANGTVYTVTIRRHADSTTSTVVQITGDNFNNGCSVDDNFLEELIVDASYYSLRVTDIKTSSVEVILKQMTPNCTIAFSIAQVLARQ
jgi:hypothetical protein